MNNLALYGHKFFLFGGAILIACAVLQFLVRPRSAQVTRMARIVNASNLRGFVFVCMGFVAILVGLGFIPLGSGH